MQNIRMVSFFFILSVLILSPVCAFALTFTLSDDAIMALDSNDIRIYGMNAVITEINDINGPGVIFEIKFPNTHIGGPYPEIGRVSSIYGGNHILVGRDISMFDDFALRFTLLSAKGISSPDSIGTLITGAMISQKKAMWAFYPKYMSLNSYYPSVIVSQTGTDNTETINLVGFVCYIPITYEGQGYENTWDPNGAIIRLLVEPDPDALILTSDPQQVFKLIKIDKCTVTACNRQNSDKISVSGKMNPTIDSLNDADSIDIALDGSYMDDACVISIPINKRDYIKTGKVSYTGIDENGIRKSFKLDLKTHKFSFSAQKLDLSGLSCPLNIRFDIADYNTKMDIDESIVNGPKKPIPINLLMGIKNSIRIDRISFKNGSKDQTDRLYVKGGISLANLDTNMVISDFTFKLAGQPFDIPANNFKANKAANRFTCSNIKLSDGSIASADFNFKTCTFTLSIRNANIEADPDAATNFSIEFADFNASAEVLLP